MNIYILVGYKWGCKMIDVYLGILLLFGFFGKLFLMINKYIFIVFLCYIYIIGYEKILKCFLFSYV